MAMKFFILTLPALLLSLVETNGEDWPSWRGPYWNGSSSETALPTQWSLADGIAWVADLPGISPATPVVVGGKVFVNSMNRANDKVLAFCVDAVTGKILWTHEVCPASSNNASMPSPLADARRVWFLSGTGALAAFSHDGDVLWKRDLTEKFGPFTVKFGYSSSPVFVDGNLLVTLLRRKEIGPSYIIALNPETGATLWSVVRTTEARAESSESYATALPIKYEGGNALAVEGGDCFTIHSVVDGAELWRLGFNKWRRGNWRQVASMGADGDGFVAFMPRGETTVAFGKKLMDWRQLWSFENGGPDVCSPLIYRDFVFIIDDRDNTLLCLDRKNGTLLWRESIFPGRLFRASPVGADGKVYCLAAEGDVAVYEAGAQARKIASFNTGVDMCFSSLAVSHGSIFIRSRSNLLCVRSK
jgi:outer membrane protein assembly factor BamB